MKIRDIALPRLQIPLKLLKMHVARVQEFSLSTLYEFKIPVPFAEAKLEEVAKAICASPLGFATNPLDFTILRHNQLFSYSLTVPIYNHVGQVTVSGQAISINFKQGRGTDQLDTMVDATLNCLAAINPPVAKRFAVTFAAHAVFENPQHYSEYMNRYAKRGRRDRLRRCDFGRKGY
ncbi:MAG TPA: hypothetical protein VG146_11640 [Verrucomicrobiae bacterium]|nr:hypothetical protein [Verrucomicrobiae bacterium]